MANAKTVPSTAMTADRALTSLAPPVTVPASAIAHRAYELYIARAHAHGHDVDDWLEAERELQTSLASRLDQLADDGDPNFP